MVQTISLTGAKAKLSELISRVHFGGERFAITRKGKAVAIVSPVSGVDDGTPGEGLIRAKGALSDLGNDIDEMVDAIYAGREKARDRKVDI